MVRRATTVTALVRTKLINDVLVAIAHCDGFWRRTGARTWRRLGSRLIGRFWSTEHVGRFRSVEHVSGSWCINNLGREWRRTTHTWCWCKCLVGASVGGGKDVECEKVED